MTLLSDADLQPEPAAGAAQSPRPASVGMLVWTLLMFALFSASLALCAAASIAHSAARNPAAPALYDPASASLRREAIVDYGISGAAAACTRASNRSPGGRVVCPPEHGAIVGSCDGADSGELLVTRRGTGWACPKPVAAESADVDASVICCKPDWRSNP